MSLTLSLSSTVFFFWQGDPKEMIFAALRAQDFGSGRHGDKGQPSAVKETIYIAYVFLPENFFFMEIHRGAIS